MIVKSIVISKKKKNDGNKKTKIIGKQRKKKKIEIEEDNQAEIIEKNFNHEVSSIGKQFFIKYIDLIWPIITTTNNSNDLAVRGTANYSLLLLYYY